MKSDPSSIIYIDEKKFSELSKEDLLLLSKKTIQFSSHMKNLISWHKKGELPFDVLTIRAWTNGGHLVGWAYVELNYGICQFQTGLYIQREYRRRGIGSMLISRAKKFHEEHEPNFPLIASPWDNKGRAFFKGHNILTKGQINDDGTSAGRGIFDERSSQQNDDAQGA